jgi:2-polyprenyl-6-methoxyphenol hydroxylase-like FAD-dependent oxidoreductase
MTTPLDVLVIGAGPTGLTLAGELLRRGLRVRIVDKLPAGTPYSKAIGVHARTLEILEDFGVSSEIMARGLLVDGVTMRTRDEVVMSFDFGGLDTRFPFILCVSQVETETVLTKLLARRGGAVDWRTELVSFAQDATGIDAVLRTDAGEERVRASWIVGCDGAHSAVRHGLAASFEGHTYEEVFLLADVRIAWDAPPSRVSTYFAEDGVAAFFPMIGGRWRVIVTAAASLGDAPTLSDLSALVERRVGKHVPMDDAAWISPFRIHCRQVERYRHGRAFLAGDAAHIHSPIGGQGMNTGIHDAHNLAWKLAWVQRGRARPELLDSYHLERHPIGKHVLGQTDFATRVGTLKGLLAPVRNHVARFVTSFEPVRRRIMSETAELTVGYEKSPISHEHGPVLVSNFGKGPKPGARAPSDSHGTQDAFTLLLFSGKNPSEDRRAALAEIAGRVRARWGDRIVSHIVTAQEIEERYDARAECLYLVRPDLYVAFRSHPADGDALDTYLSRLLTERS